MAARRARAGAGARQTGPAGAWWTSRWSGRGWDVPGGGQARAVVLLGAPGSGKTALAAALLAAAGAPAGDPPVEGRLAHGALVHRGARLHLLDPPGDPDAEGAVQAGLRAADAVVLVVSPVQGVEPRTVALWETAAHLPRLVVLTQLDRPGADADEAVAVCQRVLGEGVLPLQLPLHDDDGTVGGLLDLLSLQVRTGGTGRAADLEHVRLVEALRDELLEAVLSGSEDEDRFTGWLGGVEPPPDELAEELAAAVARGDLQPVLVAGPGRTLGLVELLDLLAALPAAAHPPIAALTDGAPAEPLAGDPGGPPVAECLRSGPGTTALLRVWSGTLVPGGQVRAGDLVAPLAMDRDAGPGEVVEVALDVLPGQAVTAPDRPLVLAPWPAPAAQLPVGVADADADGLARRVAQDPVAGLDRDPRTGQLLLWATGPRHAELLLAGLPSAPVRVPPGGGPVRVEVRVPAWCARTVRSDLTGRGGEVLAEGEDDRGVVLDARLPLRELVGYALALARASGHTGSFVRR